MVSACRFCDRLRGAVGHRDRAGRPAGGERLVHRLQPTVLGDRLLVARLRLLGDPAEAALDLLVVGQDQLGLDRLDVGERVDAAVGVRDVGVLVAADDVADRVGLADRGEELVAEPLAFGGALDQPGDVVEVDRRRHQLRAADRLPDLLQPLVGHLGDRDVGLDRRERVVAGLGAALGQGVEEGRLAGVRQPDDPDLHRVRRPHKESGTIRPRTTPRMAPARTSDG